MSDDDEHFQRVLVPVDFEPASDEAIEAGTAITAGSQHVEFSDASLRAVKMAAALCKASQGKLYMVHVTPPMQYTTMYTGPVSLPAGVIDEIHDKARSTSMAALKYLTVTYCQGIQVEHSRRPRGSRRISS
jgi:nucleotide-binding universal stress UspA family protein